MLIPRALEVRSDSKLSSRMLLGHKGRVPNCMPMVANTSNIQSGIFRSLTARQLTLLGRLKWRAEWRSLTNNFVRRHNALTRTNNIGMIKMSRSFANVMEGFKIFG
jgi:hypothetical protein